MSVAEKKRIRTGGRHFWLGPAYVVKLDKLIRRVRKANPKVCSDTAAFRLLIDLWEKERQLALI